jgi:hypothetical protein
MSIRFDNTAASLLREWLQLSTLVLIGQDNVELHNATRMIANKTRLHLMQAEYLETHADVQQWPMQM